MRALLFLLGQLFPSSGSSHEGIQLPQVPAPQAALVLQESALSALLLAPLTWEEVLDALLLLVSYCFLLTPPVHHTPLHEGIRKSCWFGWIKTQRFYPKLTTCCKTGRCDGKEEKRAFPEKSLLGGS